MDAPTARGDPRGALRPACGLPRYRRRPSFCFATMHARRRSALGLLPPVLAVRGISTSSPAQSRCGPPKKPIDCSIMFKDDTVAVNASFHMVCSRHGRSLPTHGCKGSAPQPEFGHTKRPRTQACMPIHSQPSAIFSEKPFQDTIIGYNRLSICRSRAEDYADL